MRTLLLTSILAVIFAPCASQAQIVVGPTNPLNFATPGTLWQGAGIYDATHRLAATGVDYKLGTFQRVLGLNWLALDLHSFAGATTNKGIGVAALTLGMSFPLATNSALTLGIGGDEVVGFAKPGLCVEAALWVRF